jgi:hypothetical protein
MPLRDSLRKPERITTAAGVRIAATRDSAGHADEFWSLALRAEPANFAYDPSENLAASTLRRRESTPISLF